MNKTTKIPIKSHLGIRDLMGSDQSNIVKKKSYSLGIGTFILISAFYFSFAVGTLYFDALLIRMLCSVLMGLAIAQLFIIGHDACHNSLTPSQAVNQFIGRLALLPSLHAFTIWEHAHNKTHHIFTMLKDVDTYWAPLSVAEYESLSPFKRRMESFYRSPIGVLFWYLFNVWWVKMIVPPPFNKTIIQKGKEKQEKAWVYVFDCLLVWTYFGLWVSLAFIYGAKINPNIEAWEIICFSIVLPFFLWNFLMSFVIYLHHTHPKINWFKNENEWDFVRAQVASSAHVIFPGPLNMVILFIMEHTAHHLMREAIPFYRLKMVQQKIEEKFPNDVIKYHWSLNKYIEIATTCKLYDYEDHQWLSFDGKPTANFAL
jgi:omega-6 fatty acid desaturase (delta-12 desaturase)